ncbi:host attachment family protein [Seohaeicola nanhaiensis]|uniref:Host attachment family protein n=1 Tax=Seohaeicola nanhaiensis TaxID=1387282 RepID=A0ABV9KIJ6_9RHOB
MAELKEGTWVVVTDSEKALFLRNLTDHEDPNFEVVSKEEQENPPSREQGANRPGRMNDNGQGQKSAMDDTDWHQLAKERFAADLSDRLYARAHRGDFDSLVLVASPQVLGNLRESLHKEVSDKIIAEVPKTLTNHPLSEIEKLVKSELDAA